MLSIGQNPQTIISFEFNVDDLKDLEDSSDVLLSENSKGKLYLHWISYLSKPTFLQHIHSNIKIFSTYLIDFSSEFGHTSTDFEENLFLAPISHLQNILQYYRSDKFYPVFGTGACFLGFSDPSRYFAITGNIFQPEIPNHQSLISYYSLIIRTVTFKAPAFYSEAIENIYKQVQYECVGGKSYFFLAVFCTNDEADKESLKSILEIMVSLPISVFFVGVNNNNEKYQNVKEVIQNVNLDSDRNFLTYLDYKEISGMLQILSQQLVEFSSFKGVSVQKNMNKLNSKKSPSVLKTRTNFLKVNTNYYSKVRCEFVQNMKKNGYGQDLVKEVNEIGIPFMVNSCEASPLPFMNVRSRTMRESQLSGTALFCLGCQKIAKTYVALPCGCQILCDECAAIGNCPNCTGKQA